MTNNEETTKIAVIANNIEYIKKDVADIKETISNEYVRSSEFDPVKKIVYGLVAIILIAFATAIVGIVFVK